MSTCIELTALPYPVTVKQSDNGRFTVIYGKHKKDGLRYGEAAKEFGQCVFHALALAGKLDNDL